MGVGGGTGEHGGAGEGTNGDRGGGEGNCGDGGGVKGSSMTAVSHRDLKDQNYYFTFRIPNKKIVN